ncbi:membrane protein insertion efficiency factor YidD [bacterium]|nr:membrane protein insertion efficiency factor YidD [bacterium]
MNRAIAKITRLVNLLFIFIIRLYKYYISPLLPATCRFTPTCSTYATQAFRKYSFFHALTLSVKRILKCHPYHPGGYDPLK